MQAQRDHKDSRASPILQDLIEAAERRSGLGREQKGLLGFQAGPSVSNVILNAMKAVYPLRKKILYFNSSAKSPDENRIFIWIAHRVEDDLECGTDLNLWR